MYCISPLAHYLLQKLCTINARLSCKKLNELSYWFDSHLRSEPCAWVLVVLSVIGSVVSSLPFTSVTLIAIITDWSLFICFNPQITQNHSGRVWRLGLKTNRFKDSFLLSATFLTVDGQDYLGRFKYVVYSCVILSFLLCVVYCFYMPIFFYYYLLVHIENKFHVVVTTNIVNLKSLIFELHCGYCF